jgi:hypothetical protein
VPRGPSMTKEDIVRKLIVSTLVTLDGVIQRLLAPTRPDRSNESRKRHEQGHLF